MVVDVVAAHPVQGHAVQERAHETVPDAVFGDSGDTRVRRHVNLFGRAAVLQQDQGLDKAVHAGKERHPLGVFGADDLERTAGVNRPVVRDGAAEGVADFRLYLLGPRVLAVHADARHKGVFLAVGQQRVEVFGQGLQIGVDIAEVFRLRVIEAGLERGAFLGVDRIGEIEEIGVLGAKFLDERQAVVGRTVVDEQHTGFAKGVRQVFRQFLSQGGKAVLLVIDGHDDGEFVFGSAVHGIKKLIISFKAAKVRIRIFSATPNFNTFAPLNVNSPPCSVPRTLLRR